MSDREKIKITWDDVGNAKPHSSPPRPPVSAKVPSSGTKNYGNVSSSVSTGNSGFSEGGNILLKAWVYLGLGGVLGAFFAWVLCEPTFNDSGTEGFGNYLLFTLLVAFMSVGCAIDESIAERSLPKALIRGVIALFLGLILGFLLGTIADLIFMILLEVLMPIDLESPLLWLSRAAAWAVYGIAPGLVYGVAGQSAKKCLYGCIGGVAGAFLGGLLFDPIVMVFDGQAEASRAFGCSIVGLSAGAAMGLVEAALKDRWIFVRGGPLAGKQFVLYKDRTTLGSKPKCDLYLFKDPQVMPEHAVFEIRSGSVYLTPIGQVQVSGRSFPGGTISDGANIQIGRYSFEYREKKKS